MRAKHEKKKKNRITASKKWPCNYFLAPDPPTGGEAKNGKVMGIWKILAREVR